MLLPRVPGGSIQLGQDPGCAYGAKFKEAYTLGLVTDRIGPCMILKLRASLNAVSFIGPFIALRMGTMKTYRALCTFAFVDPFLPKKYVSKLIFLNCANKKTNIIQAGFYSHFSSDFKDFHLFI